MKVIQQLHAVPAQDGDGVAIRRIADFQRLALDPYLMLDEIRSDDAKDYIGGFPVHPHRGMETFTYIRKGGFEHRDQLGNVKAIRAGKVQWMSTGRGVVHSEMPLADAHSGLHGFQIWINLPAKDKLRAPEYQDSALLEHPVLSDGQGQLYLLAGHWQYGNEAADGPLTGLAAGCALADLSLPAGKTTALALAQFSRVAVYLYQGTLQLPSGMAVSAGNMLIVDSSQPLQLVAGSSDVGMLLLAGNVIGEKIVQMGPFVMNTQAEIMQAVRDYQSGQFGEIV